MNNNKSKKGKTPNKQKSDKVNRVGITSGISVGRLRGRPPAVTPFKDVTLNMVASGFIPSGNSRQNYLMSVPGNGLYQPMAGNTNVTNSSVAANISATAGSTALATATPPSYANWTTLYRQYRCSGSSIRVTVTPINSADPVLLSVFPATETSAVTAGFSGTSGAVIPVGDEAAQMVYGDSIECSSFSDVNGKTGNTIILSMSTAEINGLSRQQYSNDVVNGVGIGSNPVISAGNQDLDLPWSWWIGLSDMVNGNFQGNVIIKIEVEWKVRFFDPQSTVA